MGQNKMIIDITELQDMVQDSMVDRCIPDYLLEQAIEMVHEKVAVLVYCAQRIEYAMKSCWKECNDEYIANFVKKWLTDTCKNVDLDRLCGITVSASREHESVSANIDVDIEIIYNETPYFVFPKEESEIEKSMMEMTING
jgi:hypothetical protein